MIKNHIVFIQYSYIIGYDKKSSLFIQFRLFKSLFIIIIY